MTRPVGVGVGPERPDVVVVGAGIVGAACALALVRESLDVLIIDAAFAGGGTTAAAMGHLVVMDDSPAQLALTAYSRAVWERMADELPAGCEYEMRGTLWVAEAEAELDAARTKQAVYAAHGVESSIVNADELARMEPALRRGLAGALFVPGDGVLYPPNAARWCVERAVALGARLREHCAAIAIGAGAVRVRGASGAEETISAGAIVNAAGVDAPHLTSGLPIIPRKGHLVITDRYPGLCHSQLVELGYLRSAHGLGGESVAFNVQPRATGQLLIGSSRELVGRDASVNGAVLGAMVRRAISFVPALAGCDAIRVWTGFRPATPDGVPLIGRWEREPGVWIAAGHEGLGITTAPGTAALIAADIAGRAAPFDAAPYRPVRAMPRMHGADAPEAACPAT
ncbi:MAG TPA: FAD-dependent oxidoreductase [Gemmatimonadaceae bacterium]|nr:FAD-dependent oxidoreductase [Gemmatimonadaceae bacterium]